MMPNMLPRVGKGSLPNVYYNTGHGHLGWTLSACTAEMIAGVIELDVKSAKIPTPAANMLRAAQGI